MNRILDGKTLSEKLIDEARVLSDRICAEDGCPRAKLAVIQVGNDPASTVYVKRKETACLKAHIDCQTIHLDEDVTPYRLAAEIHELNCNPAVDGILLQLPLPEHLRNYTQQIIDCIEPTKDVDGLTSENQGRLLNGRPGLKPCTPSGIMKLLEENHIELAGKNVTIVGRSSLVGKPLAAMMTAADATVTLCHSKTGPNTLGFLLQDADIIVSAVGKPGFITPDDIGEGQVLIDVGINRLNGKLVGDMEPACYEMAAAFTPVPGGVGPMTVAMLMRNVLKARELQ